MSYRILILLVALLGFSPTFASAGELTVTVSDDLEGDKVPAGRVIHYNLEIYAPGSDGRQFIRIIGSFEGPGAQGLPEAAVGFDCGTCDYEPEDNEFVCSLRAPDTSRGSVASPQCEITVKPARAGELQLAGIAKYASYVRNWEAESVNIQGGGAYSHGGGTYYSPKDKLILPPAKGVFLPKP